MWQDINLIAMFSFVSFLVLAPQNLQLLNSTEKSLVVSWDPMTDVDNYLISYYPVGYETLVKQVHMPKEQFICEIVGLQPGTMYNITLYHVKKGIASEPKYLEASTGRSRQHSSVRSCRSLDSNKQTVWLCRFVISCVSAGEHFYFPASVAVFCSFCSQIRIIRAECIANFALSCPNPTCIDFPELQGICKVSHCKKQE